MKIKFNNQGLIPAIIQDYLSLQVLMLGYMNQDAIDITLKEKVVVFFSRSKNRLWKKGETSGNFLLVKDFFLDCDNDTVLIRVLPKGPTCHYGTVSCFNKNKQIRGFIYKLESLIQNRITKKDKNSYTYNLSRKGINKIAQKVGEEAVEVIIESKDSNDNLFLNEASDLLYHYLILLYKKGFSIKEVEKILRLRNQK